MLCPIASESQEELHSTIKRGELCLESARMIQLVLQSQTAIHYNRINRQDSQSIKTIAVATLIFLPSTLVPTVCTSGIFNFHAAEPPDVPRTISQYGWIYLLVCILATVCTLISWLVWYLWGRKILETARLSGTRLRKTQCLADRARGLKAIDFPEVPREESRNPHFPFERARETDQTFYPQTSSQTSYEIGGLESVQSSGLELL
jgi:hypothetical protein